MSSTYKNCQSCGIPLKMDPQGGGTNNDASKSGLYCSYCYHNGEFTNPNITSSEMKAVVKEKLREKGFPAFIAAFLSRGVLKLKRWTK